MTYKRFFKQCEEFSICGVIGDRAEAGIEGAENTTLYHIAIKGKGKLCRPFETDYIEMDADGNNFVNVKDYLYSKRYYTSSTPYHMFGFNALEPKQDWDGRLVKESFDGDNKSWLICFSGKPIINGVLVKPLDYAKLDNKHYEVTLNDAIVGVFTKL